MRTTLILVVVVWLSACSHLPFCADCQQPIEAPVELVEEPWYRVPAPTHHDVNTAQQQLALPVWPQSQKRLQHYADQLAYQLSLSKQLAGQRIVISSFVDLDEDLNQSNPLGNQLSEMLRTVLPQYGLVVIEHKLTSVLWVGPQGDFALSRDARKLARQLPMDAILTGTMIATDRGMEIQARVVEVDTQQISSSASSFIPHTVLNQIRP